MESLRREASPHLKYLKKQMEKAERSLEVQKELRSRYAEYLKREDVYVAFHTDRLTTSRREPSEGLEVVQKKLSKIKEVLRETESEPATPPDLVSAEEAYRLATKERQSLERELSKVEGQVSFIERRLANPARTEVKADMFVSRAELEEVVLDIESDVDKALGKGGESVLERALNDLLHKLKTFLRREQGEVVDTASADKEELEILWKSLEKADKAVKEALATEGKKEKVLKL